jgi:hypothetical protein
MDANWLLFLIPLAGGIALAVAARRWSKHHP